MQGIEEGLHEVQLEVRVGNKTVRLRMPYRYFEADHALIVPDVCYQGRRSALWMRDDEAGRPSGIERKMLDLKLPYGVRIVRLEGESTEHVGGDTFAKAWGNALEGIENACATTSILLLRELDFSRDEAYNGYALLYRDDELLGLCSTRDEDQFDAGFERVPLTSVPGSTFPVTRGTTFYNVSGSTGDRYPGGNNWIELWKEKTGNRSPRCTAAGSAGRGCSNVLIGGHVVFNPWNVSPFHGSNRIVLILPICPSHNHYTNTGPMQAAFNTQGLWLLNYHQ